LASRGVRLKEHSTQGHNKWDSDWGVSSLEMLFRGWEDGTALIEFPTSQSEAVRRLKEQLVTWYPDAPKAQKTDLVMALWFAELGCRDVVRDIGVKKQSHLSNSFISPREQERRVVINIDEWIANQDVERVAAI